MKYAVVSILTILLLSTFVQTVQASSINLEFYLEWEQHQINEGKALKLKFRDSDETILVEPTPFLTEDDVDRTELVFMKDRAGEVGILVHFRSEAAALFGTVTSENMGRKLVISLNKQVIATGGGVVLDKQNVENLKKNGIMVCLTATPEIIYARVKDQSHRPLLKVDKPQEVIKEFLESRRPYYAKADFTIDTSGLTVEQVVNKIVKLLT